MLVSRTPTGQLLARWRPLIGYGVALLFALVMAGFFALQSLAQYERQARTAADNLTHLLSRQIGGAVEKIDLALNTVAREMERQQARGGIKPDDLELFLASQKSFLADVNGIEIIDAEGHVRFGTDVFPGARIRVSDRPYFKRLRDGSQTELVTDGPYLGRISKRWVMIFARRINRPDGSFGGAVMAGVDTEHFREMLSVPEVGHRSLVALYTEALAPIAHAWQAQEDRDTVEKPVSAPLAEAMRAASDAGILEAECPQDHIERTFAYRRLSPAPLYIVVGLARPDYLAPWRAELFQLGAVVAVFGLVTLWLSRNAMRSAAREQATSRLLQEAVENAAVGLSIFDADQRLLICNEATRDFFPEYRDLLVPGVRLEHIMRTGVLRGKYPEALANPGRWVAERVNRHRNASGQSFEQQLSDGRRLLIIENRTPSGHVVSNRIDITELTQYRQRLEQQVEGRTADLKAALDQFRILVELSPAALAMFDRNLNYLAASRRWIDIYGPDHSHVVGKSMYEISPDMPESWKAVHRSALAGATASKDEDLWTRADGRSIWLRWGVQPWIDSSGQVGGMIVSAEDITKRKAAETALRQEKQFSDDIINSLPGIFYMLDTESHYVRWNRKFCEVSGYSPEEVARMRALENFDHEDAVLLRERLQEAFERGESSVEAALPTKDGRRIDYYFTGRRTSIEGRHYVVGLGIDITDRKAAEADLRLATERLETALKASAVSAFSQDTDLRYTWAYNPALGKAITDVIGRKDGDLVERPEDALHTEAIKREVLATGTGQRREIVVQHQGKDRFFELVVDPLHAPDGTVTGVTCAALDITDRKRNERSLERHAERQVMLLDIASSLLLSWYDRAALADQVFDRIRLHLDADVGFYFRFDARHDCLELLASLGISAEHQSAVHRVRLGDSVCGRAAARREQVILDAAAIDEDPESPLLRGMGIQAYACLPLLATDGSLLGTFSVGSRRRKGFSAEEIGFLQTVAYFMALSLERMQVKMEIQRLNAELEDRVEERTAELEAANRELQGFTYAASHDMKGPLGRINSFSTLLERNYRDRLEGDGLMFLDFICRNAKRLTILLDDLLAHAQLEQSLLSLAPVDLPSIVAQVLAEMDEDIQESGAVVRVDFPETPLLVRANCHGMSQVLRNLVGNALKYSAGATPPTIEIGGEIRGNTCRAWVRDNGIGFDMAYHDRIFEIFRRLHTYEEFPGSGVGLALVKKAMDRMHGRIWAKSEPGHGATFFLEFQGATTSEGPALTGVELT